MKYKTYWSILDLPSSTSPNSVLLVILIISSFTFLLIWKFKKSNFEKRILLILTGLFSTLSLTAFLHYKFYVKDNTTKRLTDFLNSNKVTIIEGKISEYNVTYSLRRNNGKSAMETFKVDSVFFENDNNELYQFNHFGGIHKNIFHNGLKIKITYIKGKFKNEIQKIEIEKQ